MTRIHLTRKGYSISYLLPQNFSGFLECLLLTLLVAVHRSRLVFTETTGGTCFVPQVSHLLVGQLEYVLMVMTEAQGSKLKPISSHSLCYVCEHHIRQSTPHSLNPLSKEWDRSPHPWWKGTGKMWI